MVYVDKVFYVGKKYWLCQKTCFKLEKVLCMLEKVFCCMHAYSKEQLDLWALSGLIPNIFLCPELRHCTIHEESLAHRLGCITGMHCHTDEVFTKCCFNSEAKRDKGKQRSRC